MTVHNQDCLMSHLKIYTSSCSVSSSTALKHWHSDTSNRRMPISELLASTFSYVKAAIGVFPFE